MTFGDVRSKHPNYSPAFPETWAKPDKVTLDNIMLRYECKFSPSFIEFQLTSCHDTPMADYAFDGFGWANSSIPPYANLEELVKDFRELNYPRWLSPFKTDNGDYWCFDTRNQDNEEYPVVIYDHNSNSLENLPQYNWHNFIEWLARGFDE